MTARHQGRRARPPLAPDRRAHLLAELARLGAEIQADLRLMEERKLPIALNLAAIEDGGMREVGGYSSLTAYAREVHDLPASTASEWLSVGRGCRRWPELLEALRAKRVPWSNARQLVRVATDDDFGQWFEKAQRLKTKPFRREVQEVRPSYSRPLNDLTAEEVAVLDEIVHEERLRAGRKIPYQKALARFCKRAREGEPVGAQPLVVIDHCPRCREATYRSAEGPVPVEPGSVVDPARVEANGVEGVVIDARESGPVKRAIPARVRRKVELRDKGRCVVPACTSRITELHHMDGWRAGHDPKRIMTLCKAHHDQWHLGHLRCEGDMPWTRFFLADGRSIGRAGAEDRADVAATPAAAASGVLARANAPAGNEKAVWRAVQIRAG